MRFIFVAILSCLTSHNPSLSLTVSLSLSLSLTVSLPLSLTHCLSLTHTPARTHDALYFATQVEARSALAHRLLGTVFYCERGLSLRCVFIFHYSLRLHSLRFTLASIMINHDIVDGTRVSVDG